LRSSIVLTSALVGVVLGCGDDGSPVLSVPAELVGVWVAEPACTPQCGFTIVSEESQSDSINITQFAGTTTELRIGASGTFGVATLPGPDTITPGKVRVVGPMMIVTDPTNQVDTLDYVLVGQYLAVEWRRRFLDFDFDGDGAADPAIVRGRFRKR
jgi:hypothetical protein